MKKHFFMLFFGFFTVFAPAQTTMREGDILFQTSDSPQAEATGLATHSQYSHCGILLKENNEWVVIRQNLLFRIGLENLSNNDRA